MNFGTGFGLSLLLLALRWGPGVKGKKSCMQSGIGPSDLYKNGKMNPNYMWYRVGAKVQVPVVLDQAYSYKERSVVLGGLGEIQQKTCIEFYIFNHTSALDGYDYVYITKQKQGCWSHIGRVGRGQQELSLARGCINHRTAVHEMIHALGFAHEHVRSDRDNYVRIYWQNIQPGRENNFARRNTKSTDPYGPYDYASIMHYDKRAFSMNGKDTIKPLKAGAQIGIRQTMSGWDRKKLLRMYQCGKGGSGGSYGGGRGGYSASDPDSNELDIEDEVQHEDDHQQHNHHRGGQAHDDHHGAGQAHDDHHRAGQAQDEHHGNGQGPAQEEPYFENNPYFFEPPRSPPTRADSYSSVQDSPHQFEDSGGGGNSNNRGHSYSPNFLGEFSLDDLSYY